MGSPFSSFVSEIYLQHHESNNLLNILNKQQVLEYFRCVHDLFVNDQIIPNINSVLTDLNSINPKLFFSLELEQNKKINFLGVTITKHIDSLQFSICRKLTTTDIITPANSCHQPEQEYSSVRYS
jgi:hypothetical protein